MKKIGRLLLLLFPFAVPAQNLVPNPGFEAHSKIPCEWVTGNINYYLSNWYSPTAGTPDVLSDSADASCYSSCYSTAESKRGRQAPHSGHNFIMVTTYGGGGCDFPNYREYIAVQLNKALVPGKEYYAEMYVSLADHSGFASNNIGMGFFTSEPKNSDNCPLNGKALVNAETVINEDDEWVKISGTFIADKHYQYLVIGNFEDGSKTKVDKRPSSVLNPHYDYWKNESAQYYVDDVLIRPVSTLVVTGDTLVAKGATATLNASGCKTYDWADASNPEKIIGHGPQLTVPMPDQRSFLVYSDCNTAEAIVNVYVPDNPEELKAFNGRKIRKGRSVTVTHDVITITLYDNNKVDGDSVSLWYGDSCLVHHLSLTHKEVSFTIHIDKTQPKAIILFAENQGSQPPNTAGVTIADGPKKTQLVLSSDMRTCDSVTLVYKDGD
jgi:hypothetical protein